MSPFNFLSQVSVVSLATMKIVTKTREINEVEYTEKETLLDL